VPVPVDAVRLPTKPFCDDESVNYAAIVFDLVTDQNGLSIPPHLTPAEVWARTSSRGKLD
jgi:hypothetical protein